MTFFLLLERNMIAVCSTFASGALLDGSLLFTRIGEVNDFFRFFVLLRHNLKDTTTGACTTTTWGAKVKKILVVVPTYNEVGNIDTLVDEVFSEAPHVHILFVDDNSQDGTIPCILAQQAAHTGRINLLQRPRKLGLGTAYVTAFRWALERGYEAVIEMDADHSHRAIDLPKLIQGLENHDVVIGSRYIAGGGTQNWGLGRQVISRLGSLYARAILQLAIRDLTGGFNAWRRSVIEAINLDHIKSEGYTFQIELKFRASLAGFRIIETPILFVERRAGQSKLSSNIVAEAMLRVWLLRLARPSIRQQLRADKLRSTGTF